MELPSGPGVAKWPGEPGGPGTTMTLRLAGAVVHPREPTGTGGQVYLGRGSKWERSDAILDCILLM